MKKSICTLLVIFFVTLFCSTVKAQNSSDCKYLFKMWLFLDHENDQSREIPASSVKDSTIFSLFEKDIDLHFDTLKANSFLKGYLFLSVSTSNGISFTPTNKLIYLSIPGDCNRYVLCINKHIGTSFRLQGFSGNDLMPLIYELMEKGQKLLSKKISVNRIVKELHVDNIDFACIYDGLINGTGDYTKYPCLKKCVDEIVTIH